MFRISCFILGYLLLLRKHTEIYLFIYSFIYLSFYLFIYLFISCHFSLSYNYLQMQHNYFLLIIVISRMKWPETPKTLLLYRLSCINHIHWAWSYYHVLSVKYQILHDVTKVSNIGHRRCRDLWEITEFLLHR